MFVLWAEHEITRRCEESRHIKTNNWSVTCKLETVSVVVIQRRPLGYIELGVGCTQWEIWK